MKDDFSGGSYLAVAPELIPQNGVYKIENGLLNIDGTTYKRGGVKYKSNGSVGAPPGVGLWDGWLGGARYTFYAAKDRFGKLDLDDANPVNLGGGGLSKPAPMVPFENKLYIGGGQTFDGTAMATLASAFQSPYYAVCANRLVWVVGPNTIRFSEVDNPTSYTNRFSTANEHTLPDGVIITGLATVGANLLIFTTKGAWVLFGLAYDIVDAAGTNQHRLQPYSADLVLWQQTGIAAWEGLLVVPTTNGIYLADGQSTPVRLSTSIDPYYQLYVGGPFNLGQAVVYNSHYFLPILRDGTSQTVEVFVGRLDRQSLDRRRRASFPWTFFYGAGGQIGSFAVRVTDNPRISALLGIETKATARVVDCSSYFTPAADVKLDADGSIPAFQLVTRDEILNGLGEAVPRKLRATYELIDAESDDPTLLLDEGAGVSTQVGAAWGDPSGLWGTGFGPLTSTDPGGYWPWSDSGSLPWTTVTQNGVAVAAPESNGNLPFAWRLHGRSRKRRWRLRQDTACAQFTLKSLELFVRPSNGVRRAR